MPRKLLIIVAAGAAVSVVSFALLHQLGGLHWTSDSKPGPQVTRDFPWTGSESLHIDNSAAMVTYIQGPTPKFTVTGPAKRVDGLSLSGDTLTGSNIIHTFGDDHDQEIHIAVTSPNTHRFFLSGAETMILTNYDQDSLEIHLSGAGHIRGVGKAKHLIADLSGAGNLDLAQLPVDDAKVDISGAGNATLDPKIAADVSISGAGHIGLLSKPASLKTRISGFGAITTPDGSKITTKATLGDKNDREDD